MSALGFRFARAGRRGGAALAALGLAASVLPAATGMLPTGPAATARADDVTASGWVLRTGWDRREPGLSPSVVTSGTFGQLFSTPVTGQVYAQPLVVGGTVIVATEQDWVYGLDGATGAVKWSLQLGAPFPTSAVDNCGTLRPYAGVTSTPVYDPKTGDVYVLAVTVPPGNPVTAPVYNVYGIDAQTGQMTLTVPIGGSPANDPGRRFDAFTELQRTGLLLRNGWVYAAFASYCDFRPYTGYVAGVNVNTSAVTLWSDETGVANDMAGVWQSGGGLMSDGAGRIFLTSGNGVSPAPGPGGSPPGQLAESVVRLGVQANGSLVAKDFFSPADAPALDAADMDFGSGGPAGLPVGTAAYPHLLVQAGKDGRVFALNRDNLGGREQGPGGSDAALAVAGPFEGVWGHPAVFEASAKPLSAPSSGLNDYVYYLGTGDEGGSGHLRALQLGADPAGKPTLTDAAESVSSFGFGSGSPVVTSNGADPSSAVIWVVGESDVTGANGALYAFDAAPQQVDGAMQLTQIWSAPIGAAAKFTIPATDNGRVYVGTRDGRVFGFGSPDASPLTGGAPLSFQTAAGSSQTLAATVTVDTAASVLAPAIGAVGGAAADGADPFSIGQVTLNGSPVSSFPVTVSPGDQLSVPVTFSPATPGGSSGSLTLAATSPDGTVTYPALPVSLTGEGTQDGLFASPAALSFGAATPVPVGVSVPITVEISNYGTTTATITGGSQAPSAPFSATLPDAGATIDPGQSVPVTVTYSPTSSSGADHGSFTIDGSTGNVTVNLTGNPTAADSAMTASPASLHFGSVPLGQQATASIDIANTGNLPATVTSASSPDMPFGTPSPVAANLPVNPGYDLAIPVTFTPTSLGAVSWTYRLSWTDAAGAHTLSVPVTGTGAAPAAGRSAIPPPGGGWRLNGSAQMSGTTLTLTPAAPQAAGSAVYPAPVASDGLKAQFTARIGGGNGANGMTFSLLKPARSGPSSLGGTGWRLGYGGLAGVAVVLDTHKGPGDPSANFIGIATGVKANSLLFAKTSTAIPNLRKGPHTVRVSVKSGVMKVSVDGVQRLSAAVSLPAKVLPAFTAATGVETDTHSASNVSITAGGRPVPPPGGGWSFNAAAAMSGSGVPLTSDVANVAGSAVYPAPVPTAGLRVVFNAQFAAGQGLTFSLLDPATDSAASVGGPAGDLGFGGLNGLAAAFVTHRESPTPSPTNFAGISTGAYPTGRHLKYQVYARAIPSLIAGAHTVSVSISAAGVLTVLLDGEQIFQQPEPTLPAEALLAFTASTGSASGENTVRDVAISSAG